MERLRTLVARLAPVAIALAIFATKLPAPNTAQWW
jgi:hypothetical protein